MNIGIVALLILVAVIAIGFFRKLNVGVLAMAAAVILGYVSGDYTTKEIVAGYSSSLFITLFGLTLLFGIITTNGCLEQVMRRLINVFGKMVWMVPVILFLSAWCVSALAGGFAGLAFICGITIPVIHATGYDPLMLMIIGNAGAQAGRYTRVSPDGNIVLNLLAKQEIDGGLMSLTINMTIAMFIIASLAFVFFRGYRTKKTGTVRLEIEPLSPKQWVALGGLVVMIICIMALGLDSGLVALTVSVCLIAAGVIDEKTAFHSVPWNTIIMVTGVGVLMNMVITSGGIERVTKVIAAFTNSVTASGASCMTAGVMSWFSSTLGVVVPTLTPTVGELVEEIGGSLTQIGLLSAMLIGSSSACFSPASSVGGLIISSIAGDPILRDEFDNEKAFATMFLWSVAMVAVSSLLALAGIYNIFH